MGKTDFYIYGAGIVANGIYTAIKKLYHVAPKAFVVTERSINPMEIDGIPVVLLTEVEDKETKILVATPKVHHSAIVANLEREKFRDYMCINSEIEIELMERFFAENSSFTVLHSLPVGEECANVLLYMSKFYKDKVLGETAEFPEWICPIQAGAALTDERVASVLDNVGDNISDKNPNYCELTSMYWLNKHISNEYIGLCHYRRIPDINEEDLKRISKNDIDVILPFPTIHYPNIDIQHKYCVKPDDWNVTKQAIEECALEYADVFDEIFSGQYFYNYNILVAKEAVFKDYCNWMFMILRRVEELSVPKACERADRYLGYIGENLTTLYFLKNRDKLRVAHVGVRMLV